MSGHSKWSTIKRKKEASDQRRGRAFGKLLRAIEVAVREGGPSVEGNMTLASAVEKARDYSVPTDNIERAIKRGAGDLNDQESPWEIVTDPASFREVRQALEGAGVPVASAELTMQPTVTVPLDGGQARSVLTLVETLEDNDDVQAVHANFDIPEDVMAEAG